MIGSFFKPIYYIIIILIFLILFITCFFTPVISDYGNIDKEIFEQITISKSGFAWPIPGYNTITSNFGRRKSPTAGASSFHKGLDIGAPEGTTLIAVTEGIITYTGFFCCFFYTITISKDNMKISYCHVSPNYMVEVGQTVKIGQIIGNVGPKYVYGVKGNNYHDSSGKPTNGATTGTHLHIGIRVDGEYVNPLDYY